MKCVVGKVAPSIVSTSVFRCLLCCVRAPLFTSGMQGSQVTQSPFIHLRAVGSATGFKVRRPATWTALLDVARRLVLNGTGVASYVFDRQGDRILDLDVIEPGEAVYVGASNEWRRPRGESHRFNSGGLVGSGGIGGSSGGGYGGGGKRSGATAGFRSGGGKRSGATAAGAEVAVRSAAASSPVTPTALAGLLTPSTAATPHLLHADRPERLCAGRPPWGLLGDHSQLGSDTNFSKLRGAARQQAHLDLCARFARRMQQRSIASLGAQPSPFRAGASCAVVGSGGSLSRSGSGAAIDAHEVVVRFNLAPAGGVLASHVGWKTTVRILTDKSYLTFLRSGAQPVRTDAGTHSNLSVASRGRALAGAGFSRSGGRGRSTRAGGKAMLAGGRASEPEATLILYCMAQGWVGKCMHEQRMAHANPVFVRMLRAQLDEYHGRGRLPSAGVLGIAMALSRCDRVSLYGFANASDPDGAEECGHYWECSRQQVQYFGGKAGYHDWNAQWRLVSAWLTAAGRLANGGSGLVFHDARLDARARAGGGSTS